MKIAILGGTFNPIHIGHLSLAEDVCITLRYDKIIFVPTNIPPHKIVVNSVDLHHRIKMLELALQDNSKFDIDLCEIQREGISYTIDTIHFLYEKYKDVLEGKIGLIIGQENASEFDKWQSANELAEITDIIIARRQDVQSNKKDNFKFSQNEIDSKKCNNLPSGNYTGGFENSDYDEVCSTFKHNYLGLKNLILPISSTDVRRRIASKSGWRYLVPNAVFEYILKNKLYE